MRPRSPIFETLRDAARFLPIECLGLFALLVPTATLAQGRTVSDALVRVAERARPAVADREIGRDRDPLFDESFYEPIPELRPDERRRRDDRPPASEPERRPAPAAASNPDRSESPIDEREAGDTGLVERTFTTAPAERARPARPGRS